MGLLDFLFNRFSSRKNTNVKNNIKEPHILFKFISDRIVSIENPYFIGIGNFSSSKKYFSSGSESTLLLIDCEGSEIKFINNSFRSIMYPNSIPSDNGYVELFDSPKNGELYSIYYVISPNGQIIVQQSVNALIQSSCLSQDNTLACFQTANNYEHEDGNKLFIVDVVKNQILYKWFVPTLWANSYEFDTQNKTITLIYKDQSKYTFDLTGQLLDQEKWENEKHTKLNGYQLIEEANKALGAIEISKDADNFHAYESIINLLKSALSKDITSHQKSLAYRRLGEIYLRFNFNNEALDNFVIAVSHNPKVGVKKDINRLKQDLEMSN